MPRLTLAFLALGLCCLVPACNENPVRADPFTVRAIPPEIAADAAAVVAADNAFTFDFYAAVRKTATGNLFCSPYSVATAVSMTMAGAAGGTDAEMRNVLHVSLPEAAWHPAVGALIGSLNRGVALGGYELTTANRIWAQEGFPFLPAFLSTMSTDYFAGLGEVNFAAEPEACRTEINDWVEAQTHDRIQDLFPAGSINADTRMVLANAIYFKGTWETQFDPDATRDQPFQVDAAHTVAAPLMHGKFTARFGGDEQVQIVELPYDGKDLSMLVVVPLATEGLAAVEEGLDVSKLEAWVGSLVERDWDVYLPRFTFTSRFSLNGTLADMGMPSAFDPLSADFSDLDGARDLSIQAVVHKAFVQVNEEGTEAAAATGISVGVTSVPSEFRADHPFLFLIRDNVTGSILFLGRVMDPTAS